MQSMCDNVFTIKIDLRDSKMEGVSILKILGRVTLMTPLIGAKVTYAINCTVYEVTLFSFKENYWNRNKNTKRNSFCP